jgi:ATP-dependent DNA helicase RecG
LLSSPIEYLKGVGPQRGELLKKELGIFIFADLLHHFPYRHIDKSKFGTISSIDATADYIHLAGKIVSINMAGDRRSRRLIAEFRDTTGTIELVWFQGIQWIEKLLEIGASFTAFGKVSFYQGQPQISHPELEPLVSTNPVPKGMLEPIYPSTEKLRSRGLGGRQLSKLTKTLLDLLSPKDLPELLPEAILSDRKLLSRFEAFRNIHFPANPDMFVRSLSRLKFEELFLLQLKMGLVKVQRHRFSKGVIFDQVGEIFNAFYSGHLPFELTGAQKKVIREIRKDLGSGKQMNRLLQGDVGSGKTIVALLCMLIAIGNGYQTCLMAPTEILSTQHFNSISSLLAPLGLEVRLLTGSVKASNKKKILEELKEGTVSIVVGTHAIVEDRVEFAKLGLAIIDEQHRFGVAQRAKLWAKAPVPPHVLVMTATPIPRTLAMTAYGDLDYSVIDELPPNRKPILTVHRYDTVRAKVMDFLRAEISAGRQAYVIFPLIEESEKMNYENLMKGYENVKAFFPEPKYQISMVHGKQTNEVKEANMQRFKRRETQIMVATTVIEVGVDVPNATVMVIESAEKFGLSQLHQLRGRVGRGSEKSFCILLTDRNLNAEARQRLQTMVKTNDGFEIAEKDLELRGPGDIEGTRQSGILELKLANLATDRHELELAGKAAEALIANDPELTAPENQQLKLHFQIAHGKTLWSKIS